MFNKIYVQVNNHRFQRVRLIYKMVLCGILLAPALASSANELKLPAVFSDHMVLQREVPVPVWGRAGPGDNVTVAIADQKAQAIADTNGQWQVKLSPMKAASQPVVMTITAGINTITVRDILVGDVWLCSGQSNMEMRLAQWRKLPDDLKSVDFSMIRQFLAPFKPSVEPSPDLQGNWAACSQETASLFTAVGFYFARKVHLETGIPIGLINSSRGGTRIETWMAPEGVESVAELKPMRDELAGEFEKYRNELGKKLPEIKTRIDEMQKALADKSIPLPPPPAWPDHPIFNQNENPHGLFSLYNGMIYPLAPFAIKGALWYQGEANTNDGGDIYYHKMRALIGGWRTVWGQGDFSFYFVQLPNWLAPSDNPGGNPGWANLREAQTKSLAIPRTGMAVTIDVGEANDVHPKNKKDVGERLALWALKNDYGQQSLECSGPLFKAMKVEAGRVRISFDHAGAGLMVGKKEGREAAKEDKNGTLQRFALAGTNGIWHWAGAVIEGNTVVVSSTNVCAPTAVRYAYALNPEGCNLYNREGLPASPFAAECQQPVTSNAEVNVQQH